MLYIPVVHAACSRWTTVRPVFAGAGLGARGATAEEHATLPPRHHPADGLGPWQVGQQHAWQQLAGTALLYAVTCACKTWCDCWWEWALAGNSSTELRRQITTWTCYTVETARCCDHNHIGYSERDKTDMLGVQMLVQGAAAGHAAG
jgi:hypothetical protein